MNAVQSCHAFAAIKESALPQPVMDEISELEVAIMIDLKQAGRDIDVASLIDAQFRGRLNSEVSTKLVLLQARAQLAERRFEEAIKTAEFAYSEARKYGEFFSISRAGGIITKAMSELGRDAQAVSVLVEIAAYMEAE